MKDSGVKKIFILAICENCQENYVNVKLLLEHLGIDDDQAVLDIVIPPELHLVIGGVDKIWDEPDHAWDGNTR